MSEELERLRLAWEELKLSVWAVVGPPLERLLGWLSRRMGGSS